MHDVAKRVHDLHVDPGERSPGRRSDRACNLADVLDDVERVGGRRQVASGRRLQRIPRADGVHRQVVEHGEPTQAGDSCQRS